MSKINHAFSGGKAAVTFLTCGDPNLETTAAAIRAAVENGADLIELGIPFSDPTAEGPVIQEASLRALKNGVTTDRVFDFVRDIRREVSVPMVFVTYANVVYSYGAERFFTVCRDLDVGGLILPDLPFEEKEEFLSFSHTYGVALISTITLKSAGRIPMIAGEAEGFIHVLANGGGSRTCEETCAALEQVLRTIREHTDVPCAVEYDFGEPANASCAAKDADGVISGSGLVKILAEHGEAAPSFIGTYVNAFKNAINV